MVISYCWYYCKMCKFVIKLISSDYNGINGSKNDYDWLGFRVCDILFYDFCNNFLYRLVGEV